MAGIVVSGGTYSGSGDVTTEYLYCIGSGAAGNIKPTCYLPDGTFTVTGENTTDYGGEGNTGFAVNLPREAGLSNNPNIYAGTRGTVRITTAATTKIYTQYVHMGSLAYSGAASCQIIGDYNNSNELHVESGTFWSNGSGISISGNAKVYSGGILDLDTNNINPTFGSLEIKSGGKVSGNNAGTIYISYDDYNRTDLYSVMYRNNGTFVANSGTLNLKTNDDAVMGGGGGTGNPYNVIVNNLGGGTATPYIRVYSTPVIDNDLTLSGSLEWSDNLGGGQHHVVSGTVSIISGAIYGRPGNSDVNKTFGALLVQAGGTYTAATGAVTTITGPSTTSGYLWRSNYGTFTHNSGTVYFNPSAYNGADIFTDPDDSFYNIILSGAAGTVEMYGCTIGNNFTLGTDVIFRPITTTQAFTISGTALINGYFGKDGYPQTSGTHNTFGQLKITSDGTYYATSGNTIIDHNAGSQSIFNLDGGTFIHNSGTVNLLQGTGDPEVTGTAGVNPTFWNFNAGFCYLKRGITVENSMNTGPVGYGGGACNIYTNEPMVFGTDSQSGHLDLTVNTGIKMTNGTNNISGASEAYPMQITSSAKFDFHSTTTNISNADFLSANTIDDSATINMDGVDFTQGVTTNDGAGSTLKVNSGSIFAASGMDIGSGSTFNVTGALVKVYGSYMEDNNATVHGEDSATLWTNLASGQYMSPNGTTAGAAWYKNVFWDGGGTNDGRINQDRLFADSNFIIAGAFSGQNRPVGSDSNTSRMVKNLIIAEGGTYTNPSGKASVTGNYSDRGGLFASSSAVITDGVKGVSSQYVVKEGFTGLSGATAATAEVWFKVDNTKPMDQAGLINPFGNNRWNIIVSSNPVSASGNYRLGFEWENGGTEIWNQAKVQNWDDTQWHHVAMTIDETNGYKLYFDGKLEASGAALGNEAKEDTASVMVGGQTDYGVVNRAFAGTIGRASIWSTALTDAQIRKMMFEDFDTATTTNCKLWWQFDEGEGSTTVADKSGNGNTGTLSGTASNATWAGKGNWSAGNTLSGAAKLWIGKGTNSTDFASSYFTLSTTDLLSGSKITSKAHSGSNNYYIGAGSGTTFNFSQIGNEPQPIVRSVSPPTGGSDVILLDTEIGGGGNYTFIFNEGENDQGTAKDCKSLTVDSGVTIKALTGVDYYTQDFNLNGTWERDATYDGVIHDDGSLPTEQEPIDFKQHISDGPIDTGLLID